MNSFHVISEFQDEIALILPLSEHSSENLYIWLSDHEIYKDISNSLLFKKELFFTQYDIK